MTPGTLKRYNSKWPEAKTFFSKMYSSQKVLELCLVTGFYPKNVVSGDFSIKMSEFSPVFVVVFL
jgi:hypothetical protein